MLGWITFANLNWLLQVLVQVFFIWGTVGVIAHIPQWPPPKVFLSVLSIGAAFLFLRVMWPGFG